METKNTTCPKCGASFRDARGLGSHLRSKHGIPGSSPSVLSARRKKAKEQMLTNSEVKPKSAKPKKADNHEYERQLAVAYATGQAKSLLSALAEQNGFPTAQFTAECAHYLLRSTGR